MDADATWSERARSFGPVADAYERSRPGYPALAVRWLAGDEPHDVVDLGAGTGKLTRSLVELEHRVTAVEPLPEMVAHLRAAVPGVNVLDGSAESIPLADGSADVVVVAQAFHWFDPEPALREIARVLRPGGRLSIVWNTRDEGVPWVMELSEEALDSAYRPEVAALVAESGLFGDVEEASFPNAQLLDSGLLRDLVLSRSYCAVMAPEQRAPILDRVEQLFREHAVDGVVELLYVVECFRCTRF